MTRQAVRQRELAIPTLIFAFPFILAQTKSFPMARQRKQPLDGRERVMPVQVWQDSLETPLHHYSFDDLPDGVPHMPLVMRREEYPIGQNTGMHQHDDFCVLYFVSSGQGVHVVGGQSYNLMSGDIYVLAPGSRHGFLKYQGLEMYCLYFPLDLLSKSEIAALRPSGFLSLLSPAKRGRRLPAGRRRLHLLPEQYRLAEMMVAEIFHEARQPAPGPLLARYGFF